MNCKSIFQVPRPGAQTAALATGRKKSGQPARREEKSRRTGRLRDQRHGAYFIPPRFPMPKTQKKAGTSPWDGFSGKLFLLRETASKKGREFLAPSRSRTPGTTVTVASFRTWRGWRRYRRPALPPEVPCPASGQTSSLPRNDYTSDSRSCQVGVGNIWPRRAKLRKTRLRRFYGLDRKLQCRVKDSSACNTVAAPNGEVAETAEGARLLSGYTDKTVSRVRIPPSPP